MTRRTAYSWLLLAASLVATACSDSTGVDRIAAPVHRQADASGNARSIAIAITKTLQADGAAFSVLGQNGGVVVAGRHSLYVPAGAVDGPTLFAIQVVAGTNVYVKLLAFRMSDGVQIYTFNSSVKLTLSYVDAQYTDPTQLEIVYLPDGTLTGTTVPMPSLIDTNAMTVSSWLPHFSDYTLGENRQGGDTTTTQTGY